MISNNMTLYNCYLMLALKLCFTCNKMKICEFLTLNYWMCIIFFLFYQDIKLRMITRKKELNQNLINPYSNEDIFTYFFEIYTYHLRKDFKIRSYKIYNYPVWIIYYSTLFFKYLIHIKFNHTLKQSKIYILKIN